jgi:hypothetical protein
VQYKNINVTQHTVYTPFKGFTASVVHMPVVWFHCTVKESAFVGTLRRTVLSGYNSGSLKTEIWDKTHYTTWCKKTKAYLLIVVVIVVVAAAVVVI